jgi:hypothetical protein
MCYIAKLYDDARCGRANSEGVVVSALELWEEVLLTLEEFPRDDNNLYMDKKHFKILEKIPGQRDPKESSEKREKAKKNFVFRGAMPPPPGPEGAAA